MFWEILLLESYSTATLQQFDNKIHVKEREQNKASIA